ncbi:NYN domain-containing protein [Hydrogenophaga palleronii]|uniref:NYN domain-containing protein n=1 Tax=Hydrogenophaga palleronii TaxID=65655 RepID=UPI00157A904A|nr:NYN domain-containing protein [Hydrogenophaga palleronii]
MALLIDADNSPAAKIDAILTELSTFGVTNVRRAYGNWKKNELKSWEEKLHEHAIRPMQQFDYSKGKNASDMAMVIDALELLYTDRPDAFGIVSSDADFTPLVMHLRAKGAAVYGFGAQKTPEPFVNACSRFLYLDRLGVVEPVEVAAAVEAPAAKDATVAVAKPAQNLRISPAQLAKDAKLISLLRGAVIACEDEDGWAKVGLVGTHIGNKTSFDARNYGYATLTKLLAASGAFDLRDEGTSKVSARDKRHFLATLGL